MLTVKEMAAKLNRGTTRVLQMIAAGKFPGATKKNGHWLIPEPKAKPAVPTPSAGKAKVATNKASAKRTSSASPKAAKGRVAGRPPKMTPDKKVTARKLLGAGVNTPEVAKRLKVSPKTVRRHSKIGQVPGTRPTT